MHASLLLFAGGALSLVQAGSGARIVQRDAVDAEAMYGGGVDAYLLLMLVVASVVNAVVLIVAGGMLRRGRLGVGRVLLYLGTGPILARSAWACPISVVDQPNDGGPFPTWAVVTEVVAGSALVTVVIMVIVLLQRSRPRPR